MSGYTAALGALVLAAGARAAAAEPDRQPDWLKKPTAEDLIVVWPTDAWRRGLGGKATLKCVVTVQGGVRDCVVLSEQPAGAGFGQAALALTPQFLFRPGVVGGRPVDNGTVVIPINFPAPGSATGTRTRGPSPEEPPLLRLVSGMVWRQSPSYADLLAAYPAKARAARVTGHVTLDCVLGGDGRLKRCDTAREEPFGYGFAAAAKALSRRFVGAATDSEGKSLDGAHLHLPVAFPAEALDAAAPLIGKPLWTGTPTAQEFAAVFPDAAAKAGVLQARAVLSCTVAADGTLAACRPLSEDPPGYGFAAGAASLSGKFRVNLWSDEGLPTIGGAVRVPIRYDLKQALKPAPARP